MTMWHGQFNAFDIDTDPGASGPFAPPEGWTGDAGAYRDLMRERWRHPGARQQIVLVALAEADIAWRGRWAAEAADLVERIRDRLMEGAA